MFSVQLGGMAMMFMRMQSMAVRRVGVVRGLFMIAGFGVLRRFAVMFRSVLVVLSSFVVMLVDIMFAHRWLPFIVCRNPGSSQTMTDMRQFSDFKYGD
jgi:hypothetical protein